MEVRIVKIAAVSAMVMLNILIVILEANIAYSSDFDFAVTAADIFGSLLMTAVCVYFIIHILKR